MSLSIEIVNNYKCWDDELLSFQNYHPLQSYAFARHCISKGDSVYTLHIRLNENLVGMALIFGNWKRISLLNGPILEEKYKYLQKRVIIEIFRKFNLKGFIQFKDFTVSDSSDLDQNMMLLHEKRVNWLKQIIIDLKQDKSKIYSDLNNSLRKNIKKFSRLDHDVIFSDNDDYINEYEDLLVKHRLADQIEMPYFYPCETSKKSVLGKNSRLLVGLIKVDNTYLAGQGFFVFGKKVVELGSARSRDIRFNKISALDYLKVAAFEYFKGLGCTEYDLMSVKAVPQNKKEQNIFNYKMKFNKNTKNMLDLSGSKINPITYMVWNIRQKFKRAMKIQRER